MKTSTVNKICSGVCYAASVANLVRFLKAPQFDGYALLSLALSICMALCYAAFSRKAFDLENAKEDRSDT